MQIFNNFWKWYEQHKTLNLGIAAFLFTLQIVHLIWLFGDVIYFKISGNKLFNLHNHEGESVNLFSPENLILLVDYLEIPAIVSTSLFYIHELREKFNYKSLIFLFFLNSQWLHLFWITDEIVIETFTGSTLVQIPVWLAWFAILIDYLELPVVYDTLRSFIKALKKDGLLRAFEELKED